MREAQFIQIVVAFTAISFSACSSTSKKNEFFVPKDYAETKLLPLSEQDAQLRSQQIGRPIYTLWFGVDGIADDFEGRNVIQFELKPGAKARGPVWLDFRGGTLRSLIINSTSVLGEDLSKSYNGNRIWIPSNLLVEGSNNRIEVGFMHRYSADGNGLHRFKDPKDGNAYLYTNFEPFSANQMFPCFDQPDLKATFEVTVEAPETWEVISVTEDREISHVDGRKSWVFPASHPISTYVFALHAGPYAVWKAEGEGVPLRLFARRSLIPFVDHKRWFDVTTRGLKFFAEHFGVRYPFTKYDQILVPEFNAGAMENVGAVTFSEKFLFRSPPTSIDLKERADTILHEMAHMWFGNLVTMRWWNGLWLNESFASYLSSIALDEGGYSFSGVWESFFTGFKGWAYWEDGLPTSHPIEVPVADTDQAFAQFDGITYGKGASVLKQLRFALGPEEFKKGLQLYFKRHAFGNTETEDFLMALSQASSRDLTEWSKLWLKTSGTNRLSVQVECEADRLKTFEITQAPDTISKVLRPHHFKIALYALGGPSGLTSIPLSPELRKLSITEAKTSFPVGTVRCPAIVISNAEDHGFFAVDLDSTTLKNLATHLSAIPSALERGLLWHGLKEMVEEGTLSSEAFFVIAAKHLKRERDADNLELVLKFLAGGRAWSLPSLASASPNSKLAVDVETLLVEELKASPKNSDRQAMFFDAWTTFARTESSADLGENLLASKMSIGLTLGSDRRWKILKLLARIQGEQVMGLLDKELASDPSDFAKREHLAAVAGIGNLRNKERLWSELLDRPRLADARASSRAFYQETQPELNQLFVDRYFDRLDQIAGLEEELSALLANSLFPKVCNVAVADRADRVARDRATRYRAAVLKALQVGAFSIRRCLKSREASSRAAAIWTH